MLYAFFFSSPPRKNQVSTRAYYNPVKPSCYTVEPEIFVITVTTVLSVRFYVCRVQYAGIFSLLSFP